MAVATLVTLLFAAFLASLPAALAASQSGRWGSAESGTDEPLLLRPPWPDLIPMHEFPWEEKSAAVSSSATRRSAEWMSDAARGCRMLRDEGVVVLGIARDVE